MFSNERKKITILPKQRLGRTELQVTNLGFGALGILDRYLSKSKNETGFLTATNLFEFILDNGINLVDTARWYDDSEERIGAVLATRRSDCIIVSKTMKRDSVGAINDITESLNKLQTNYIDIYLIHHVQWEEELNCVIAENGALQGMLKAKNAGKIGFIGISGHNPELLCAALSTGHFDIVEFPHNALDYKIFQPVIDKALEFDIGVITMKVLAAGKFTDSKDKIEKALRFAFCVNGVGSALVGLSTKEQVLFNVEIAQQIGRISPSKREQIISEIAKLPRDYWGVDTQNYDANACPFDVPIEEILRLERYRTIYKNGHRTKWEYSKLPINACSCSSCPGYCELTNPYGISTRKLLIKAHNKLNEVVQDREILQHGGEIVK